MPKQGGSGEEVELIVSKDEEQDLTPYVDSIYTPVIEDVPMANGDFPVEDSEISTFEAGLAFLKSNWGLGFLGTPFAFRKAGVIGGIIGYTILIFVIVFTTRLLIKCKEELRAQGVKVSTLSEISRTVFGRKVDFLVTLMIALSQLGTCTLYIIFIARSFEAVFQPRAVGGFYYLVITACTFPILIPIVMIRKMKYLLKVVYLAIFFMTAAVVTIIIFGVTHANSCVDPVTEFVVICRVRLVDYDNIPVFLGIVSFGLEGIQNVMPIHEAMRDPSDFNNMLYAVYGILSVMYVSFGIGIYSIFADVTQSVIALNITDHWGIFVKTILAIMLICTFPLQMFPVAHIVDNKMKWTLDDRKSVRNSRIGRALVLCIPVGAAMGIPYFGNLLSLIGCTCVTFLGFFLPAIVYLKNFHGISTGEYIACFFCIVAAVTISVSGMYVNIQALAHHPD